MQAGVKGVHSVSSTIVTNLSIREPDFVVSIPRTRQIVEFWTGKFRSSHSVVIWTLCCYAWKQSTLLSQKEFYFMLDRKVLHNHEIVSVNLLL